MNDRLEIIGDMLDDVTIGDKIAEEIQLTFSFMDQINEVYTPVIKPTNTVDEDDDFFQFFNCIFNVRPYTLIVGKSPTPTFLLTTTFIKL